MIMQFTCRSLKICRYLKRFTLRRAKCKVCKILVLIPFIYVTYLSVVVILIRNGDVDKLDVYKPVNRSRWMAKLTGAATLVPITWLAIPGSHNSGTRNLQPSLGVVPNQTMVVKILNFALNGGSVIRQWSQTQHLSIREQLAAGIRYFDLRVGFHLANKEFRFVHGLYGDLVLKTLKQIYHFLKQNRREIVILDFNRFYDMGKREHSLLLNEILRTFDEMIIPAPSSNFSLKQQLKELNLQSLWKTSQRVIVLYHEDSSIKQYPTIWPRTLRDEAYVNSFGESQLLEKLQSMYSSKNLSQHFGLHVWQGISTPNPLDILTSPFSGLLPSGNRTTMLFTRWLKDKQPGQEGVAICTADFVEKHDFIQTVIDLNKKISET